MITLYYSKPDKTVFWVTDLKAGNISDAEWTEYTDKFLKLAEVYGIVNMLTSTLPESSRFGEVVYFYIAGYKRIPTEAHVIEDWTMEEWLQY